MTRNRRFRIAAVVALAAACGEHTTDPGRPGPGVVSVPVQFHVSANANLAFKSVDQVRLIARNAVTNVIVDSSRYAASSQPGTAHTLDIRADNDVERIVVSVELLHNGGVEPVVEMSGISAPFALGQQTTPVVVNLLPGPLTNLQVSSITILDVPVKLLGGESARLSASTNAPAGVAARIYWGSSDPAVVSVDSIGTVQALSAGVARITAQAGPATASADITVTGRAASIELTPSGIVFNSIGEEASIEAQIRDARGGVLPGVIDWSVADTQVVRHVGSGRFRAVSPGSTRILAGVSGEPAVSASVPASVSLQVVGIHVTPPTTTLNSPGDTVRLSAAAVDAGGSPVAGVDVQWATSNPLVATINQNGLVTAHDPGTATITATVDGKSGTAEIRVDYTGLRLEVITGDNQVGRPGSALATSPTVRVTNARQPVNGVEVSFSVSGGSIEHPVVTTGVDGIASPGAWILGNTVGAYVLTASANGLPSIALTATATQDQNTAWIGLPSSMNLPHGHTGEVGVQLYPAASGAGITVTLTSSDENIVRVTPTLSVAPGRTHGSAVMEALQPGVALVTASAPGYASASMVVSTRTNIHIFRNRLSVFPGWGGTFTIELQSGERSSSAPSSGLTIQLASVDSACVSVPPTATMTANTPSVDAPVSYGGTALLPCNAYVRATAVNYAPDSVLITVAETPRLSLDPLRVGAGLQQRGSLYLSTREHPGVTVTITGSEPGKLLFAPSPNTPGSDTLNVFVPKGHQSLDYVIQSVGPTGIFAVTASAQGFLSKTVTDTVVTAAIELDGLASPRTTFSADDPFTVRVGVPDSTGAALREPQAVRMGGAPLPVTLQTDSPAVALLVTGDVTAKVKTIEIPPGASSPVEMIALRPAGAGTTVVHAAVPGALATTRASQVVKIDSKLIRITGHTVGAGLQRAQQVSLNVIPANGTTVRLTSSDPTKLLLSTTPDAAGSASIDVPLMDRAYQATFYTQALEGTSGPVHVTATAPEFAGGSTEIAIVAPAIDIEDLLPSITTLTPYLTVVVRIGLPAADGSRVEVPQPVRAGSSGFNVTISSSNPTAGDLILASDTAAFINLTIGAGKHSTPAQLHLGAAAFRPVAPGITTVSVAATGTAATTAATRVITVTGAVLKMYTSRVGAGLQRFHVLTINGPNHGGMTIRIRSTEPEKLLIAPDKTTAGTEYVDFFVPDGRAQMDFWVQGLDEARGDVMIEASAAGAETVTAPEAVVEPALRLMGPSTVSSPWFDEPLHIGIGIPSAFTPTLSDTQARRWGAPPLALTVTSSTEAGQIVTRSGVGNSATIELQMGASAAPSTVAAGGFAFRPAMAGTTVLSASIPGFRSVSDLQVTVHAAPKTIELPHVTVGAGLQQKVVGRFSTPIVEHGLMIIEVPNPNIALVSPDGRTAGSSYIQLRVEPGTSTFEYYVQGVEGAEGTTILRARSGDYADGGATITVVKPAVQLITSVSDLTQGSQSRLDIRIGLPSADSAEVQAGLQSVRSGSPGLAVAISSSNPSVAKLVRAGQAGGATITVDIPPGSFGLDNVGTVEALSVGTTTLSASAVGYLQTKNAFQLVRVNSP